MIFSIVIPAFNKEEVIERAILSCLNQNIEQEYEIVIADNASTDKTFDIAKKYACEYTNVKLYSVKTTDNMWANHNRCLKYASGDYVLFCHTDDVLMPHALQAFYDRLVYRDFPEKYVVWGHSMYSDFKRSIDRYNWGIGDFIVGEDAFKVFANSGLTPSGTCYSRKSFFDEGGFIEDEHLLFPNSDSSTMMRLAFDYFAFEMLDNMIFLREQSSSYHIYARSVRQEKEFRAYMINLIENNFTEKEIIKILYESFKHNFYYSYHIAGMQKYRKLVFKLSIKYILFKPKAWRSPFACRTLRRLFSLKSVDVSYKLKKI